MKAKRAAKIVAGVLLITTSALSETHWRKTGVTLGWTQQPNPDETGKSSAQISKLLGNDSLKYTRSDLTEKYRLSFGDARGAVTVVEVFAPRGTALAFTGMHCDTQGLCESYGVNRANGASANVEYSSNAPPEPPPSPVPNTGLVAQ